MIKKDIPDNEVNICICLIIYINMVFNKIIKIIYVYMIFFFLLDCRVKE